MRKIGLVTFFCLLLLSSLLLYMYIATPMSHSVVTNGQVTATQPKSSCITEDGTTLTQGQALSFYRPMELGATLCTVPIQRTCQNGVLSGDASYSQTTCVPNGVLPGQFSSPKGEDISITTLADGTLLMARAIAGFTPKGSSSQVHRIALLQSTDNGQTWQDKKIVAEYVQQQNKVSYSVNNAFITQVPKPSGQGVRLLIAFHLWQDTLRGGTSVLSTHSIETMFSDDGGVTWSATHQVARISYDPSNYLPLGLWEPFAIHPKINTQSSNQGYIQIYYSQERDNADVCANSQPGVKKGQDIVMKESFDGGVTWSDSLSIVLRNGKSREGIPTIAELSDGTLVLAHEHLRFSSCTETKPQPGFMPGLAWSYDGGKTWIDKTPVFYPHYQSLASGWIHMIVLSDGRLLVRFAQGIAGETGLHEIHTILTTNHPNATTDPIWQQVAPQVMNGDLQWGTVAQAHNGDIVVTGSNIESKNPEYSKQFYRVVPLQAIE